MHLRQSPMLCTLSDIGAHTVSRVVSVPCCQEGFAQITLCWAAMSGSMKEGQGIGPTMSRSMYDSS